MKQDIENIIRTNLPENRYELGGYPEEGYYMEVSEDGEYIKSDEIDTSLIADEVLKVVGESKRDFIIRILGEQHKNELQGKGYDFYFVLRTELDNLSLNKENKNNE